MKKQVATWCLAVMLIFTGRVYAQLDQIFTQIINQILVTDFQQSGTDIVHKQHFKPAAQEADATLRPALNSLITGNISSFPLSSTVAGVTFDFSSGRPVSITESLGPIFAETAQTLGRRKLNIGLNYTYLSLSKLRGLPTKDIRFTFTHQETGVPPLGSDETESDLVELTLGLDVNANILAFSGTYGVTDNFDIGVAIPVVKVSLDLTARAVIDSYTRLLGGATHRFGGSETNPDLIDDVTRSESATGVGDIALRLKYSFQRGAGVDLAALMDIRLPTGNEEDFLGTGKANARVSWIMSKKFGEFTPHLNLGYERRAADLDSDELELALGFDQKVANGFTFAAELLGEFDLNSDETIKLLPGTQAVTFGNQTRQIDLSNVPEKDRDHVLNAAFGFRAAPSERFLLLGNIIVSMNDSGLRSGVIPTLGATLSF